jgi:hypothetical protein
VAAVLMESKPMMTDAELARRLADFLDDAVEFIEMFYEHAVTDEEVDYVKWVERQTEDIFLRRPARQFLEDAKGFVQDQRERICTRDGPKATVPISENKSPR